MTKTRNKPSTETQNDEVDLARIDSAMRREEESSRQQLRESVSARDPEAELAEQIAEDRALEAELQREREQAENQDLSASEAAELRAALPSSADDIEEIESCVEALLFISDRPVTQARLRELLGPEFPLSVFQEALTRLRDRYAAVHHGIELVEVAGGYQLRTKPGRAALARKLAKTQTQRLSSGAMETLAIVAYKQPVMKEDIDKIRGVDSSYFIRGLLEKKLIRVAGRSDLPGRPMLYSTSDEFLQVFGLKDLSAMPPLHEIEAMVPASQARASEDDPRIKEMRRLVGEMKADPGASLLYDPREDDQILREIRERVQSIPTSTPYIEEQRALENTAANPGPEAEPT